MRHGRGAEAAAQPSERLGPRPRYRPEIDGLRAIAILPVVLFHAALPGFGGGFIGVDVFFVISGYLITQILVRDLAAGDVRYAHFYERRARRIVPALLPVLGFSALLSWLAMTAEDFRHFGRSLGATALFGSNVWYALRSNYFLPDMSVRPLLHTWSLAVEEQFYIAYPLVLAIIWKVGRRLAMPAEAGLLAASMAAAFWLVSTRPEWAFFMLPTRLWELMAGAVCALAGSPRHPMPLAGWIGLALLVAGFAAIGENTPVPGPLLLLPVAGTMLLILFANGESAVGSMLSTRPLVGLGLISYGTYLWHLPLFALASYVWFGGLPALGVAALVTASLVLGALSYRVIERPVRERRIFASRRAIGLLSLGGLALFAALGIAIATQRLGSYPGATERAMGGQFAGDGIEEVVIPPGQAPLDFVLYGDSHARQYYRPFSERFGTGALLSEDGCLSLPGVSNVAHDDPDPDQCRELFDRLARVLRERKVGAVVFAQLWDRELWGNSGQLDGDLASGDGRRAFESALDRAVAAVPNESRVVIIGHVPAARPADAPAMADCWPRCERYLNATCPRAILRSQAEGNAVNRVLSAFAARHPRVIYLDPADVLCGPALCPIVDGDRLIYNDESHVALDSGRRIAARVAALLDPAPAQ
jgi:peptidoglycan/LPS O-acetylase OafA/YrhL